MTKLQFLRLFCYNQQAKNGVECSCSINLVYAVVFFNTVSSANVKCNIHGLAVTIYSKLTDRLHCSTNAKLEARVAIC